MAKKKTKDSPANTLRQRAEARLRTSPADIAGMPTEDIQSLVHELQVHQIELEIQNEELRQAQIELGDSRDRYSNLYEYAPAGYLTLDQHGKIRQANLSASRLLEVDRKDLVGAKFPDFIDRQGQDEWYFHRQAVFAGAAKQTCELPLRTANDQLIWVRLESEAAPAETGGGQCRTVLLDVTDRKRAEELLRESEWRFRVMTDSLPLIVWMHDDHGRQEYVNQTFCDYFGVHREEMRAERWKDLTHPEDATAYQHKFLACLRNRKPFHAEIRVRRADGKWRWMESWGRPRFGRQGEYLGQIGVSADITSRKKAEDKVLTLNASLEQQVAERTSMLTMLRDIAAMANEASDVEAAIMYALRRISEYNGWSCGHAWLPDQSDPNSLIPGYAWYEHAPPRFERLRQRIKMMRLARGEDLVGRVFAEGTAAMTTDITQHLSIDRAPVAENLGVRTACAFPIVAGKDIVGVLEFFAENLIEPTEEMRDSMASVGTLLGRVVERVRSAETLRTSEQHLQAILDAAPDSIVSADRRGVITRVNPQTQVVFGYAAEELVGQNVNILMPSPYREEYDSYINRYFQSRDPHIIGVSHEVWAQCKDGRVFPVELAVNVIDRPESFIGIIRDISRRKELEKEVVDAASNEQRRIGQDIHDGIGQELTGLRYMAQTHAESLAQQSSPHAPTAERMTQWLTTVQQQLRDIIRRLVPVEVDKQGLVAALRGLAQRTSERHDLVCEFQCQKPVAIADTALATHLYRIVQEAVANAVRHAHATHIGIGLTEYEDALRLQVADDGSGIPPTPERNTGIGLRSMAYRAGLIGATLTVRAGEQGGTTVTCAVPKEGYYDGWRMPER